VEISSIHATGPEPPNFAVLKVLAKPGIQM